MTVSETIDELLAARWQERGVVPAPVCDDAVFLRRVTLDLAGRVPTREEREDFLANPDRLAWVERWLDSPDWVRHWSELWTTVLNGYAEAFETDREALRLWLEERFREGTPYDEIATGLITATGTSSENGAANFLARYPDEEVNRVSRLFLGVRLDCARCHDHPYDRWTEDDYAKMARFFDTVDRSAAGNGNVRVENRLIESDFRPRFLTGAEPRTALWRDELALFIRHTNAFARSFANRVWYQLLGRGIVHPPDDFSDQHPPSVPSLLDYLAVEAKRSGWDLRALVTGICGSLAYQRGSRGGKGEKAAEVFAAKPVKPLTPEQWFDSVSTIFGEAIDIDRGDFLEQVIGPRLDEDFSSTWQYRESVPQMMRQLALDLPVPGASVADVFHAILTRDPTADERALVRDHSLADLSFALLHSSEFSFHP